MQFLFFIHLGNSLNASVLLQLSPFCGRIPLPGSGIVGKNWSAQSKTTVRSKGFFPLKVRRGPFTVSHSEICSPLFSYALLDKTEKGGLHWDSVPRLIVSFAL